MARVRPDPWEDAGRFDAQAGLMPMWINGARGAAYARGYRSVPSRGVKPNPYRDALRPNAKSTGTT